MQSQARLEKGSIKVPLRKGNGGYKVYFDAKLARIASEYLTGLLEGHEKRGRQQISIYSYKSFVGASPLETLQLVSTTSNHKARRSGRYIPTEIIDS